MRRSVSRCPRLAGALGLGLLAATPLAAGSAADDAIYAAALEQQVEEHLDATARREGVVVCLGIDPGGAPQSPSREFMARLAKEPAVRRLAACDPRPDGAVEAMTLRPAVIVTVGPIERIAEDEAWVTVTYFRSSSRTAARRYRVVRERSGWVSLGPILLDGPV
jgi:hypothetical protein